MVLRGRLRGKRIDLEEEVTEFDGEVEVFVRAAPPPATTSKDFLNVIASLSRGNRSKAEIDHDLTESRSEWDVRA